MSSNNDSRIVIELDLDYFYAQCEEVRDPSLKTKPVVVCVFSGRTEDSGAVSTSNYIARGLGIKSGMPVLQAKKLLRDYPFSVFLPTDMEYYKLVSERIMEIIRSKAGKFEQSSIDEAYIDVTSEASSNYQKAESIGRKLKAEILSSEKLTCSVGIGQNKLMAKMAVDSRKPDGFTVILPEQVKSFLDTLPVGKLFGIGPKTDEKLRAIGIMTVGALARSDPSVLSDLLGKNLGPALGETANGVDNSPVVERPAEQFSRIVTLKRDADTFDFAEVLQPMAEDLAEKLTSSRLTSRGIGIIAITNQLKIKTRSKTLPVPTKSPEEILKVVVELFSSFFSGQALHTETHVRRVGVKVTELVPDSGKKAESLEDYLFK